MKKEFKLSEKGIWGWGKGKIFLVKDIKEFIRKTKEEDNDFEVDVISLIEINRYSKEDLIAKVRRLCKAHNEEIDSLAGDL